jgi:hypothetical protein
MSLEYRGPSLFIGVAPAIKLSGFRFFAIARRTSDWILESGIARLLDPRHERSRLHIAFAAKALRDYQRLRDGRGRAGRAVPQRLSAEPRESLVIQSGDGVRRRPSGSKFL